MKRPRPPRSPVLRFVAVASLNGLYGGPYDTAREQARLLNGHAFDTRVVAGSLTGPLPGHPDVNTFPVRHLVGSAGFSDVFSLNAASTLWREVGGALLVHISIARELTPVLTLLYSVARKRPIVLQPHGMLTGRSTRWHRLFDALVLRPLARRAKAFIALTDDEAKRLRIWLGGSPAQIFVVSNPVTIHEQRSPHPSPQRRALFAARLHPRKRVLDFAQAAKAALAEGWLDDHYFAVGPDGGDAEEMREAVKVTDNLAYVGATDQAGVQKLLNESRVFVLPSLDEPWGNVLTAALYLGRPAVVTKSAALAEAISVAGAGIVVDDSSPEQIAGAVHELLDDDNWAGYSERAAQLGAELLDTTRITEQIDNVYRRALQ